MLTVQAMSARRCFCVDSSSCLGDGGRFSCTQYRLCLKEGTIWNLPE